MDIKINLIDEINKNRTVSDERLEQQDIKNQKFELNIYRIMIVPCIILSSSTVMSNNNRVLILLWCIIMIACVGRSFLDCWYGNITVICEKQNGIHAVIGGCIYGGLFVGFILLSFEFSYRIVLIGFILGCMAVYYLYVMAYNRYLKTTED